MIIRYEDIEHHLNQRKEWNSVDLNDVELFKDGVRLAIDPLIIKELSFTGLNTIDLVIEAINMLQLCEE